MKCVLCKANNFICIHEGTRDVASINVMKCKECGMVQLDCFDYNTSEMYSEGGMLKESYSL